MSQGLLYMGKGMLSIQPYYSERFLLSKVGMAGVIIFLTSLLDIKSTLLSKQHYFIYFLSLAMYPKFLFVVKNFFEYSGRLLDANTVKTKKPSSSQHRQSLYRFQTSDWGRSISDREDFLP
jgi:hypothetical protein